MRLDKEFYQQDAVTLAQDLLGTHLVREVSGEKIITKIVETEAYVGPEDKACHAYDNKKTERTKVMFASGGQAYVYLIYGMYHCFNVVSGSENKPEAVLVRAVEPVTGWELIKQNRDIKSERLVDLTNGPGKLCQALMIDRSFSGYDLITGDELYLTAGESKVDIVTDKRINIDYAEEYRDKLWRFYIADNDYVSQ
ncbi:MAG: DNA-3-methyladenine glycosylase [Bacillota bacterium]